MAENLGEAQLRLTVDTGAVDKELKRLRDAIQNFAPDFKAVKAGLRTVSVEAKAAADSAKSLAFNLNQVPSSKLEGLGKQIKTLQTNLRGAKIQSEEFLSALTRIQELEGLRDIRVGRQSALAGQRAYSPEGAFGQLDQSQLPQLPLTLAGERQNIDELKKKLSNLDYESAAYGETLRVLQRAQERYNNILNGTSAEYQKLAQQEEAAIRRAEKLTGIQSYYADRNPRAGGVRNESGAMLARGAGSVSDERAYQAALRPARELLETDLKREQVLRQISQRILATAKASEGGFGAASASNFATTDPVAKAIRRNAERSAQRLEALAAQREALESDLVDVQRRRLSAEERSLKAVERGREIGRLNAVDISGRLPGGGFAPGSPGALDSRNRRLREAGSNALIGGAFPALFGQGLGASVGGAVGGGAGGLVGGQFGFGLSLLGTAVGSQFDLATQKLQTLGNALGDPVKQFNALSEAGLLSSKSLEKQIQALIDTGREAEAAALIQKDLATSYGDLKGAKELAASSDELNRSWAKLQATTALLIGSPLVKLLSDTTSALLVFTEVISKLRNAIPEPIAKAAGDFGKQLALGGLLPGVKTIQDAARAIPGSAQGSSVFGGLFGRGSGKELQTQNTQLQAAKKTYAELNTLAYQQAAAQSQGNKELELSLRRRQIELQLQRDTAAFTDSNDPGAIRRQALNDKAKQDIFALDEQLKSLNNGSLTDLQERLSQLNNQRLRVPVDSDQFKTLGVDIEALKKRIEELQRIPLRLDSLAGLQQQISELEARQIKLSVDSSAFTAANQQILETQNALEQLDGKKAIITVEQINAGVQDGSLTNNFSNLEKRSQAAQQALNSAAFDSPEFQRALRAAQEANFELDQRRKMADPAAFSKALEDATKAQQDAAQGVKDAFGKAEQAADSLAQSQKSLRSALEGSFDLLTSREQQGLLRAAQADIQTAVNAGIFDPSKVGSLRGKGLLGAAGQARSIMEANENLKKANNNLVEVNKDVVKSNADLIKATQDLSKKNWGVNVSVNANTGDYAVNLG